VKRRIYILGIVVLILLLAVGSCRKAGTRLVKENTPEHADAMVMLMGSTAVRTLHTADLYTQDISTKVWIVESSMGTYKALEDRGVYLISRTTQANNALIGLGVPADSILILPGDAESTMMEAQIVRKHLETQTGIDTLLLVSSSEHTRRAYKIFKAANSSLDKAPVLCCSPSTYTDFNAEQWWRSKEDIQKVLEEYLKLLNFALFERGKLRRGTAG
jgi:uncharacterized SAM-binding protein YcdF (DUF218 family)